MHWSYLGGSSHRSSQRISFPSLQEEAEFHPLILFKQHAVQTNEIFLLVADLFARFCSSLDHTGGDISTAISTVLAPYETFQRNLWWDVAVGPDYEQEKLQHTLRQLVSEAWELLNRAFRLEERGIAAILSAEYIARSLRPFLSLHTLAPQNDWYVRTKQCGGETPEPHPSVPSLA
jgi:hypothetical protein